MAIQIRDFGADASNPIWQVIPRIPADFGRKSNAGILHLNYIKQRPRRSADFLN